MTEWQPPKDPGKFAAWAENFIEQLPKFAKELGISPDEINEFAGGLTEWKTEHVRGQLALLQMLRERLEKVQRENQWHPLFTNAFARTPVTREPGRSEMLRLLAKWIVGMEQTRGARRRRSLAAITAMASSSSSASRRPVLPPPSITVAKAAAHGRSFSSTHSRKRISPSNSSSKNPPTKTYPAR
jgi:hypothetical protein